MTQRCRYEGERLRVIAARPDFGHLVSLAFSQILENAEGNAEILLQLLSALERIASAASDKRRRQVLRRQVDEIEEVSRRTVRSNRSRESIEAMLNKISQTLDDRERVS